MMRKPFAFICAGFMLAGIGRVSVADTVVWTIDSDNSFIRLNVPDQPVNVPPVTLPDLGLRGFNGDTQFPSNVHKPNWLDDDGKRSFVGGVLVTDYVEGLTIEFLAGEHTATAVEYGDFWPDPNFDNVGLNNPGLEPAPAAFGAVLVGLPNSPDGGVSLGFAAFRDISYDLSDSVNLQATASGWENLDGFRVGLQSGKVDAIIWLGVDPADTHGVDISAVLEPNVLGGLVIENLGGSDRKITISVNIPLNIDLGDNAELEASITGEIVAFATIPTLAIVEGSFVSHSSFTGAGSKIDTVKSLAKEGEGLGELSFDNLINTSQGINGIVFDIQNLADGGALSADDFEFQISPTGVFDQGANPPANWNAAPAPSSVSVTAGSPDRVLIQWGNGSIVNRWLRVTVKATANTGLAEPEVYYVGHLLGETTGLSGSVYTVAFADITPIRSAVGNTANASSTVDIDKNGIVNFADISAMRSNVGAQLSNITVP